MIGSIGIRHDLVRRTPRSNSGTIDFSVLYPSYLRRVGLSPTLLAMAGNLTAILPEDLSFPGLADVNYLKLVAALAAFPVVAIVLNVLSQLVCALHPGEIYLTYCFLVSTSRQESPSGRFSLDTRCGLRCRVWDRPYGIL